MEVRCQCDFKEATDMASLKIFLEKLIRMGWTTQAVGSQPSQGSGLYVHRIIFRALRGTSASLTRESFRFSVKDNRDLGAMATLTGRQVNDRTHDKIQFFSRAEGPR